ncbi:MAG TPA: hemerythrin domain-containing protein [Candidatus Binatia bacterium]|jgi:hypothetical protein
MAADIFRSLQAEHEEFLAGLAAVARGGGAVGAAAKAVAKLLDPHLVKEKAYALPPLEILSALVNGRFPVNTRKILGLTEKLRASVDEMLDEHKAILLAARKLARVAEQESKVEPARLAEKLIRHAKAEEEIFYPVVILIGEYLKLKTARAAAARESERCATGLCRVTFMHPTRDSRERRLPSKFHCK